MIKVITVMLLCMMTESNKIIAMFSFFMGTLVFRCALLIYGWMSTHMAVVTVALIVLAKIRTTKQKYFEIIKSINTYKLKKQGFIKTRFLVRKRKLLDIHRQSLKTGLLIICTSKVIFNFRKLPGYQVQNSNWNISVK